MKQTRYRGTICKPTFLIWHW